MILVNSLAVRRARSAVVRANGLRLALERYLLHPRDRLRRSLPTVDNSPTTVHLMHRPAHLSTSVHDNPSCAMVRS